MSAASDKVRFYLEQSVPELREYERKKIFSKVSSSRPVSPAGQQLTDFFPG